MTLERKLAIVALALGLGALFGEPVPGSSVRLDTDELARLVQSEVDHVTVEELADWLIQQRADFRLLDLRSAQDYASYHIPGAEQVLITDLSAYPVTRNETILLYSNGGIHSAQAWFLLQARGYRASYILLGGLQAWQDHVLFPVLSDDASSQGQSVAERQTAISAHFGGQPRTTDGSLHATPMPLPKVEAPAVVTPVSRRKRGPKEGC